MKHLKRIVTMAIMMVAVIALFQSCKKSGTAADYNSDKTKLNLQIDSATILYNSAVEGKQAGDYAVGSKAPFETAITLATNVKTGSYTQYQVNNTLGNLIRAIAAFKINLVQDVSPENLVAYWKFTGNTNDTSGNAHNGTLKTGWVGSSAATAVDGGTLPVLTTDRYGNANNAYHFNNGAYIEVPYSADLRPSNMTITAWIKPDITNAGNYVISLDRWNGYKFQIQSNNFPYFTINTDGGDLDVDDNPVAVTTAVWSQIAVSYTTGAINFYINGVLKKTVAKTGNPIPLATPVNMSIGNEMPKTAYNFTDSNNSQYFYGASFFIGSLDDIRLYNIVLTDSQIKSIYTMESPN